jgi:integrase
VLDAAKGERLWPYVAVSMLGGIRTEEARALRWSEVDLEAGTRGRLPIGTAHPDHRGCI